MTNLSVFGSKRLLWHDTLLQRSSEPQTRPPVYGVAVAYADAQALCAVMKSRQAFV